ncbi:DUF3108 domain-containing protein [Flavobacterium sp. ANB]|uniref:DUF3108 domain-containing protein n=1 Tax=unclassified Flavobacterium TaxID=196869 RepID=UPI0012B90439|nr:MULTISPECIES: DUF3108 domain-containing protein [unclassified Flavobacterium]MBF4517260.1 DUF3108 domain-containing protein [Flavobacterium sp. ANB]MTD70637.1 DUF3108 domain-containing protein [Flavobacterium sp. LC2016-13]
MKKLVLIILILTTLAFDTQKEDAYGVGEYFKFRIHYGIVNAGYATLEVKDATINNKKVFHAIGKGYTTGMSKFFFKVEDIYESYFDKQNGNPYRYIRKIDEGGYTKDQEGIFNPDENRVLVKDYKRKTEKTIVLTDNVQDIVSSFYYLRNHPNIDKLKSGESITIDMFFDEEITKFKLKYIGLQDITTKFGTVSTMVFKPLVQTGRVFKEKESLTIWITDDDNKVPVRIKADLAVGSLKADLDEYKGLKSPFKVKK